MAETHYLMKLDVLGVIEKVSLKIEFNLEQFANITLNSDTVFECDRYIGPSEFIGKLSFQDRHVSELSIIWNINDELLILINDERFLFWQSLPFFILFS